MHAVACAVAALGFLCVFAGGAARFALAPWDRSVNRRIFPRSSKVRGFATCFAVATAAASVATAGTAATEADGTATADKPKKAPRKRKVIDPELNDAAVRKRFKDEGWDAVAKFPGDELIAFLKKAGVKGNFGRMKKDELVGKAKEVLASAAVVA